jgi:hypothetical protein
VSDSVVHARAWLDEIGRVLRGEGESRVACGTCTACCASSQFVVIEADEHDARARIPSELCFPVPGGAPGDVLLGYDEQGRCPMLTDTGCSIYDDRPRACRRYDCRVITAAGVDVAAEGKPLIAARAARWELAADDAETAKRLDAIRRAAATLGDTSAGWPDGTVPATATGRAVLAVVVHEQFVDGDPPVAALTAELTRLRDLRG